MAKLLIYQHLAQINAFNLNICSVDQVKPCLVEFCRGRGGTF